MLKWGSAGFYFSGHSQIGKTTFWLCVRWGESMAGFGWREQEEMEEEEQGEDGGEEEQEKEKEEEGRERR